MFTKLKLGIRRLIKALGEADIARYPSFIN
jgi:hypothetical protein